MKFQLLRHATSLISYKSLNFLLDPMLSPKGALGPIANAANQDRIPLVDLPFGEMELRQRIAQIDAVLVTHLTAIIGTLTPRKSFPSTYRFSAKARMKRASGRRDFPLSTRSKMERNGKASKSIGPADNMEPERSEKGWEWFRVMS